MRDVSETKALLLPAGILKLIQINLFKKEKKAACGARQSVHFHLCICLQDLGILFCDVMRNIRFVTFHPWQLGNLAAYGSLARAPG